MRRFSQRNQLVTLNEINITPLLDLAFVLLIIFVITTPMLERNLDLKLPEGGGPKKPDSRDNVLTEVSLTGVYSFKGRPVADVAALERELVAEYRRNTNMVVVIRADASSQFRYPVGIIDLCRKNGINRFDIPTQPDRR